MEIAALIACVFVGLMVGVGFDFFGWRRANAAAEARLQAAVSPGVVVQAPPKPSAHPAVWTLVIADMRERDAFGTQKYSRRLTPHDGRDSLVDAYQEALDQAVYLRKELYERNGR